MIIINPVELLWWQQLILIVLSFMPVIALWIAMYYDHKD